MRHRQQCKANAASVAQPDLFGEVGQFVHDFVAHCIALLFVFHQVGEAYSTMATGFVMR